jgi:hypothetical protein
MIPPQSRLGPLTDTELAQRISTPQARKYAQAIDRESAREMLAARLAAEPAPADAPPKKPKPEAEAGGMLGQILSSTLGRSALRTATTIVTGALVRGVLGSLVKPARRRR